MPQEVGCPKCPGAPIMKYTPETMIHYCPGCKNLFTDQYLYYMLITSKSQKPKTKVDEKPCLKCKAMRAMKYDLKKDWYQCTICLYCYSPETMAQVKSNFTYPGTAKFLKSFFPFFVASAYPNEYQAQLYQQKYQPTFKPPVAKPSVPGYRERASIEFEGVEELDPSLWGDADSTGLL